jgi:ribosome-associated translation inhibitor RaiA
VTVGMVPAAFPLRVTARNVVLSVAEQEDIRRRVEHLRHYCPAMLQCHVTVDQSARHRIDRELRGVRIDLLVPGAEIVVARQPRRALQTALDNAFRSGRRRLEDYVRRRRGDTKTLRRRSRTP